MSIASSTTLTTRWSVLLLEVSEIEGQLWRKHKVLTAGRIYLVGTAIFVQPHLVHTLSETIHAMTSLSWVVTFIGKIIDS